jgi:hypothetical protein
MAGDWVKPARACSSRQEQTTGNRMALSFLSGPNLAYKTLPGVNDMQTNKKYLIVMKTACYTLILGFQNLKLKIK